MPGDVRGHFATAFDPPAAALAPPVELGSGGHEAIRLVDGFFRGVGIVGRFSAVPGLLALKVAGSGRPLRVEVLVRVDRTSDRWWHERVPAGLRTVKPHTRVLLVRSQGTIRAAAMLVRPGPPSRQPARALLRFDLGPDELVDDGLLMLEFQDVAGSLPGRTDKLPARGTVGVAVMRIDLTPVLPGCPRSRPPALDAATGERWGVLSTGDLPEIDGHGPRLLSTGSFVVNPPPVPLGPEGSGWTLVGVRAELDSRAWSHLPDPVARMLATGAVGQALTRADAAVGRLKPLRVAAARQLRAELNLPKLAAAIERSANASVADPESLLVALHRRGALRATAVRLSDRAKEPLTWVAAANGSTKLRLSATSRSPILVHLGVDEKRAGPVLAGRRVRWTLTDVRATSEDVFIPLAGRGMGGTAR